MVNAIVVIILVAITSAVVCYLVRAKKRGDKCIGCPYAKQCGSKCNVGCNGHSRDGHNRAS
ncbi:MAG: FeoB-associated Cys-rich membrane protein [Clostridia bacterium]|nr:FeoB-associated Cys-rich membrane protein [Clostridia bacterium]